MIHKHKYLTTLLLRYVLKYSLCFLRHSHAKYSRLQQSPSTSDDIGSGERELVEHPLDPSQLNVNDKERVEGRGVGQSEELFDDGSSGSELREIGSPESFAHCQPTHVGGYDSSVISS